MSASKPIVLFDGVCNLCNSTVQFIIKHDPEAKILFSSLQGNFGQNTLRKHGLQTDNFDTFLFIKEGQIYDRSSAFLQMSAELQRPYKYLQFLSFVPKPIRDGVYSLISKNRYRLFGKSKVCMIPSKELKSRFL